MELRQIKKKRNDYPTQPVVSSKVKSIKANIKKGLKEMQQFKLGKLKVTSANDFLKGL